MSKISKLTCLLLIVGAFEANCQGTVRRLLPQRYPERRNSTNFDLNTAQNYFNGASYHHSSPHRLTELSADRYHTRKSSPLQNDSPEKLQDVLKIVTAGNNFCLNLMKYMITDNDNTIMAPISLSVALSMVYFAAASHTRNELSKVLHYDKLRVNQENIVNTMRQLREISTASKVQGVSLELGNLIFAQKGLNISRSYRELIRDAFGGYVENIDFSRPKEATAQMNKLISSLTKGQIVDAIEGVVPSTRMLLTNAVYFKGFWKKPFSVRSSFDSTFLNYGESQVPVRMMYMRGSFLMRSLPDLAADAIQLPYEGDDTMMLILLPKDPLGVNRMLQKLDIDKVLADLPTYTNESLDLYIPRFSVRGSYHLKQVLYSLGIKDLFTRGRADLPQIDPEGQLVVDDVVHEAKIRVDERGTEAVAVSTAAILNYSRYPSFSVAHPFVFFVVHKQTGSILFAGKILRMNDQ